MSDSLDEALSRFESSVAKSLDLEILANFRGDEHKRALSHLRSAANDPRITPILNELFDVATNRPLITPGTNERKPMAHSISTEELARIMAKVYEPNLDWGTPAEYDLLDREELTTNAQTLLNHLSYLGYSIERLDDLALDEMK